MPRAESRSAALPWNVVRSAGYPIIEYQPQSRLHPNSGDCDQSPVAVRHQGAGDGGFRACNLVSGPVSIVLRLIFVPFSFSKIIAIACRGVPQIKSIERISASMKL